MLDGDERARRRVDDWRRADIRPRVPGLNAGKSSRVSELQNDHTPASSRDSDAESVGSNGDHIDELQRKRRELLSQLKVSCISAAFDVRLYELLIMIIPVNFLQLGSGRLL